MHGGDLIAQSTGGQRGHRGAGSVSKTRGVSPGDPTGEHDIDRDDIPNYYNIFVGRGWVEALGED